MRRANNKIVGGIVLLAIVLVAIGYAAITNVTLNINGTAKSKADQSNFAVEFIGVPTTGGGSGGSSSGEGNTGEEYSKIEADLNSYSAINGVTANDKYSSEEAIGLTETPVIKQNMYPYSRVSCSQAQSLASSMGTGEYTSSLMFGVQWLGFFI